MDKKRSVKAAPKSGTIDKTTIRNAVKVNTEGKTKMTQEYLDKSALNKKTKNGVHSGPFLIFN